MNGPWLQVVYASTAEFPAARAEVEVAQILRQSRRNNDRLGVVGALYYDDGFFFQCLEGPVDVVDMLYQTIGQDARHSDVVELARRSVDRLSFERWAMKHVLADDAVPALLARFGLKRFNPYRFDLPLIDAMIELLHRRDDAPLPQPADASARAAGDAAAALVQIQRVIDAGEAARASERLSERPREPRTALDVVAFVIAVAAFALGAFGIWTR